MKQGKKTELYKSDYCNPDFYKFYLRDTFNIEESKRINVNKNDARYLTYTQYARILKDINIAIFNLLLYEAFILVLPFNLGELSIRKKKVEPYIDKKGNVVNLLPVDRQATKRLWESDSYAKSKNKLVYHSNDHSEGYVAKLYYDKTSYSNIPNRGLYKVQNNREMKLALVSIMKSNFKDHDFYEINKNNL